MAATQGKPVVGANWPAEVQILAAELRQVAKARELSIGEARIPFDRQLRQLTVQLEAAKITVMNSGAAA